MNERFYPDIDRVPEPTEDQCRNSARMEWQDRGNVITGRAIWSRLEGWDETPNKAVAISKYRCGVFWDRSGERQKFGLDDPTDD